MKEHRKEVVGRTISFRDSELDNKFTVVVKSGEFDIPIRFWNQVDKLLETTVVFHVENLQELTADPNNIVTFYSWK